MKNIITTGTALLLTTSLASAGGLDRSGQSSAFIFEDGDAATLSFGIIQPTISSDPEALAGDVGVEYNSIGFGIKRQINDKVDMALIFDQPYGADISYGAGPLAGTEASVSSSAITALASYGVNDNVSVFGGLRLQNLSGSASVPAVGGYTLETESSQGTGYVVGAAYEKPEIALRVALTYNSEISHTLTSTEFGAIPGEFDVVTPQSINLDFQSGVAADTLVFGSIRWVEWSEFDITPANYPLGSLVDLQNDSITYTLGVGRRFSDKFSGSFSIGYEEATGDPAATLAPTDGYISYSIGGEYQVNDQMSVRGGIRYVDIGDATTTDGIPFAGNSAVAIGGSVNFTF